MYLWAEGLTINSQPDRESDQTRSNKYDLNWRYCCSTLWKVSFCLQQKKKKKKPTACKLPVNVWQCRQIQTWRHCSMIHSVTGVNLRETGVRGTNRSHVGKGSPLMPPGLLCERRQEGKRRAEYWWCQLPCAVCVELSRWCGQKKRNVAFSYLVVGEEENVLERSYTTCITWNKDKYISGDWLKPARLFLIRAGM